MNSLSSLPWLVQREILDYLDLVSLYALSCTSHFWYEFVSSFLIKLDAVLPTWYRTRRFIENHGKTHKISLKHGMSLLNDVWFPMGVMMWLSYDIRNDTLVTKLEIRSILPYTTSVTCKRNGNTTRYSHSSFITKYFYFKTQDPILLQIFDDSWNINSSNVRIQSDQNSILIFRNSFDSSESGQYAKFDVVSFLKSSTPIFELIPFQESVNFFNLRLRNELQVGTSLCGFKFYCDSVHLTFYLNQQQTRVSLELKDSTFFTVYAPERSHSLFYLVYMHDDSLYLLIDPLDQKIYVQSPDFNFLRYGPVLWARIQKHESKYFLIWDTTQSTFVYHMNATIKKNKFVWQLKLQIPHHNNNAIIYCPRFNTCYFVTNKQIIWDC